MRLPSIVFALMAVPWWAIAQDEAEEPPVQEMRLEGSPDPEPEPPPVTEPDPLPEAEPTATDEAAAAPDEAAPATEAPAETTDETLADEEPPAEEENADLKALETRLADQQEEIATLRRQLEESQRQSEQLEEVVTELENVELSVDDLRAFEQQRVLVEQQRTEALAGSVALLDQAGRSLYYGSDDVLDQLEAAGATLDGEAQHAALVAAELVRRGDLFNARSWVDLAHELAQRSLQAEGSGAVGLYP